MREYQERDLLLKELGYGSYADYLASELWKQIRRRVLGAHRGKCGLCGGRANQVHHLTYSREAMLGKGILHYCPVCEHCHKKHEFCGDRKVSLAECNASMRAAFFRRIEHKRPRKGKVAVRAAIRNSRKHSKSR